MKTRQAGVDARAASANLRLNNAFRLNTSQNIVNLLLQAMTYKLRKPIFTGASRVCEVASSGCFSQASLDAGAVLVTSLIAVDAESFASHVKLISTLASDVSPRMVVSDMDTVRRCDVLTSLVFVASSSCASAGFLSQLLLTGSSLFDDASALAAICKHNRYVLTSSNYQIPHKTLL